MTKQTKPTNTGAMPVLLASAELNKAIEGVLKTANGLQTKIQMVGVQALMHLSACGDVGPMQRMVAGFPKGMRRNALVSWFLAHGAVMLNPALNAEERKAKPIVNDKSKKTDPEAAFAENWFDHLPEKDIEEVFDLQKAINSLLQRAKGKTIKLAGVVDAQHATDALKALAVIAGADYTPDVKNAKAVKATEQPAV